MTPMIYNSYYAYHRDAKELQDYINRERLWLQDQCNKAARSMGKTTSEWRGCADMKDKEKLAKRHQKMVEANDRWVAAVLLKDKFTRMVVDGDLRGWKWHV